jgi:membrane associated rhomboid family serine protease
MGLNDRDYAREPSQGFHFHTPQTAVGILLAVNIGLYLLDIVFEGSIARRLSLSADLFERPWNCWQLVTSAFVHSTAIRHILINMLLLWMFGTEVERLYGRNEFLRIYFAAAVIGGLCWVASENLLMPHSADVLNRAPTMVGASGAVTCIWVLFALHFPNRMILFGGFLPMPMWLFGFFNLIPDLFGFLSDLRGESLRHTAFEAHLGGAALALMYQRFGWNFGRWLPQSVTMTTPKLRPAARPKLKLHQPATDEPTDLETEVDRILEKIHATGFDSLSADEKRALEKASAKYQKRRQ